MYASVFVIATVGLLQLATVDAAPGKTGNYYRSPASFKDETLYNRGGAINSAKMMQADRARSGQYLTKPNNKNKYDDDKENSVPPSPRAAHSPSANFDNKKPVYGAHNPSKTSQQAIPLSEQTVPLMNTHNPKKNVESDQHDDELFSELPFHDEWKRHGETRDRFDEMPFAKDESIDWQNLKKDMKHMRPEQMEEALDKVFDNPEMFATMKKMMMSMPSEVMSAREKEQLNNPAKLRQAMKTMMAEMKHPRFGKHVMEQMLNSLPANHGAKSSKVQKAVEKLKGAAAAIQDLADNDDDDNDDDDTYSASRKAFDGSYSPYGRPSYSAAAHNRKPHKPAMDLWDDDEL